MRPPIAYMHKKHFSAQVMWLVIAALVHVTQTQEDGVSSTAGLFPPITFTTNFASRTEVTATSTCSQLMTCAGGSCPVPGSNCNETCPFGEDVPSPFSLLEEGTLSGGVERVSVWWL